MTEKFNEVCPSLVDVYPTVKGSALEVGRRYRLERLEKTQALYGEALLAIFDYNNVRSKLYMPKAYLNKMEEKDIASINSIPHFLILIEQVVKGGASTFKYKLEKISQ